MSSDVSVVLIIIVLVCAVYALSFAHLFTLSVDNAAGKTIYPILSGDSAYYAHWAENLLKLHAYQGTPGIPLRAAPPGYSAFIAGILFLTRHIACVIVAQTLCLAFALVFLFKMTRSMLAALPSAIVILLFALEPMVLLANTSILTDGLFTSLLIATLYLAFFQKAITGTLRWALVGVLLGICTMIRPIGQFLVIVIPTLYLLRIYMTGIRPDPSRVAAVCACVAGFIIVVFPWMVREDINFGAFEISPLGGHNLLTYDVRGFLAWRALQQTDHPIPAILVLRHVNDPIFTSVDAQIAADLTKLTPPHGNRDNYEGSLAVRYILHDPIGYTYFDAINTTPFFIASSIGSYRQIESQLADNEGFYAPTSLSFLSSLKTLVKPQSMRAWSEAFVSVAPIALEILFWTLVTAFSIYAIVVHRREWFVILCAVLVLYFAGLTGPMASSRYRVPAVPFLLILGAVGAQSAVQSLKQRSRQILKS